MKRAAGRLCVFLVTGTWLLPSARAQSRLDSLQRLDEVVIEAQTPVKEVIPAQRLAGDGLQRLGAHSVADAIRYFSGVQIKDYGGVGGLKTVNIRSMGTNHVGVFYDGIELGNAQNGVVDLGRFSLDNMEAVTLYNGQKSAIFQPAKDFSSAGSIYLQTRTPFFREGDESLLRPMILKDVAALTGLDISTISRVSNSKYVQTNYGIYPLKFFFSDGYTTDEGEELSVREIRRVLKECVEKEDKSHPLTDDELARILKDKGFAIARRTVAKYREQLGIPVARLRK